MRFRSILRSAIWIGIISQASSLPAAPPKLPLVSPEQVGMRSDRLAIIDELNAVSDHQYHMTRARFAALPNAVLHRNASAEAAAEFPLASIDLVFIDARHDWPFVAEDLALWAPRVRPGGIVAGHDFSPMFPGVVDAVLEYRAG